MAQQSRVPRREEADADLPLQRALLEAQTEAARAALAQERAAREAAVQRSARLHALHRAALELSSSIAPQPQATAALLGTIVQRAVEALHAHDGWVVLAEDSVWRHLVPGSGPADGHVILDFAGALRRRWLRLDGAEMHVLETGETVEVPDTLARSGYGPYAQLAQVGIHAFGIAPLRAGGGVLGLLGVTFRQSGHLPAEDWEALELFAAHAAAAVDRARLVHAERRRAAQAERLAGVLAQVGAAADLDGSVEALLRGAVTLLEGDEGTARLFVPTAHRELLLRIERTSAVVERSVAPAAAPGSIAAALAAGGPPVLVVEGETLDAIGQSLHGTAQPSYEAAAPPTRRSSVNVPIPGGDRRIGSLHVYHHEPGAFGAADLALAEALATHAQAAIARAVSDAARREAEAARERALVELARQTEEAARREAEAAALRELDRLKDELLSTIAHELRTPLSVIYGYAQRLQAHAGRLDAATLVRSTDRMLAASTQLKRLVEDLLDFGRLQRGEVALRVEVFDLAAVLRDVVTGQQERPGGERLAGEWPATLPVRADPSRVTQAVENLLENALRYAPEGPIVLRAGPAGDVDGMVRVLVEDQGPGIPYDEQPRVWEKFFRGAGVAGLNVARGSGVGLAVVKTLVEAQGGQVGLESTPGAGARFWFDLPAVAS